jgi:CRP/FNR family cyclic AMP-dependent transcriptional regulator
MGPVGPSVLDELADGYRTDSFLTELPAGARTRLLASAVRVNLPAGALIDDGGSRVFVVLTGLLRVFIRSPDGRQVTVGYARRGDVVRLANAVAGPGPTPPSIQTMTGASLAAIRVDSLRSLLRSDVHVARACVEELASELNQALDDISRQSFLSVRERVARHLLDIAQAEGGTLRLRMTQQDLADAVGSVREVVARTLHRLRDERLISTSRDEIVILNPIALSGDTRRREPEQLQALDLPPQGDRSCLSSYSSEPREATTSSPSPAHATRGASRQRRSRS